MHRLYRHADRFMINRVADELTRYAIPFVLKNEFAAGAVGELSPFDSEPEIWLLDESDVPRATRLLDELNNVGGQSWVCAQCGERNEPAFDFCWQCQQERPASTV